MHDDEFEDVPLLTEEDHRDIELYGSRTDAAQDKETIQGTRWFYTAVVAIIALLGSVAWHHLDKMEVVEPFVVTVEVTDDGHVTIVNPPKPMKEFIFPPEAIMGMLAGFVVDRQRLGEDRTDMEDRRMNVDAAVCGPAAQQIAIPPKRDAALVMVTIETLLPTASPQTYRIGWSESWHDKLGYHKGDHKMIADITVVRRVLDWSKRESLDIWTRQPMGMCISSFLVHELPK